MDGRWYVAGRCLLRKALRTFRLDRVSLLELCEEGFDRPADFDIQTHLRQSMPFVQSSFNVDVWLDLPIAEVGSHFALHRVAVQEENGGIRIQCTRERIEPFAAMLLSIHCRVVVHAPDELKKAFANLALRAAAAAKEI
jgi:predicted DNA-binding transcriptional regulator YafY